jgi:hypothetical protein
MFNTGVSELIEKLIAHKPYQKFTLEMTSGDPVAVDSADQIRLESEAGLAYIKEWHKNTTTVLVLSKVVAIHVTGQI